MSRWGRGWAPPSRKQPAPARGIRIKQAGTTWWGQRWIAALEHVLRGDAGRLARGRTYARAGRTHDLVVEGGAVTAKVTGSRPTPYRITIRLSQLDAAAWTAAIAAMAAKAQFSAELLAGQMPLAIEEAFVAASASLFPQQRADLQTSCSCPDWGDPCKHVAAAHYVLGEALDRDPFLLFELRGRTKAQVLDALRAARGATEPTQRGAGRAVRQATPEVASPDVPTVKLGALSAADYDRPREALPSLHFLFEPPVAHGAVIRQLGAPAAWSRDASPADVLAPMIRAAAHAARRIALAEPDAAAEVVATPEPQPPSRARKPSRPRGSR